MPGDQSDWRNMKDLNDLRIEIDKVDSKLLTLIAKRIKLVKEVGIIKKQIQKPIVDKKREQEKIALLTEQAKKYNLNKSVIKTIWTTLFRVAYKMEE